MEHRATAQMRERPCRYFHDLRGLWRGESEIGLAWASLDKAPTGTGIEAEAHRHKLGGAARRVSRRALRALLTRQTGGRVAPADWEFGRRPDRGAEVLTPERGWEVSVAYSGGHCAVAAAARRRLGVDLEAVADFVPDDLPEHLLSPEEIRLVRAAPDAFWSVWTLKEAFAKEFGCGLAEEPAHLDTAAFACREPGRLIQRRDGGTAMHCRVRLDNCPYALAFSYGPRAEWETAAPR